MTELLLHGVLLIATAPVWVTLGLGVQALHYLTADAQRAFIDDLEADTHQLTRG